MRLDKKTMFGSSSVIFKFTPEYLPESSGLYWDQFSEIDAVPGQTYTFGLQDASAVDDTYTIGASASAGTMGLINPASRSVSWTAPADTNDGTSTAVTLTGSSSLGNSADLTINVRNTLPGDPSWGEFSEPGVAYSDVTTWRSFAQLSNDLANGDVNGGGTTGYHVIDSDLSSIAAVSVDTQTIENSYVTGAYFPAKNGRTWSKVSGTSNTWECSLPDEFISSISTMMFYAVDGSAPRTPPCAVFPESNSDILAQVPFRYSWDWWRSYNKTNGSDEIQNSWDVDIFEDGAWITEETTGSGGSADITALRFSSNSGGIAAKAQFEAYYASGSYVIAHTNDNVMVDQAIQSYDSSTGVITLAGDGLPNFAGFFEFALIGATSLVRRPGQYAVDTVNKKVYYWPEYVPSGTGPENFGLPFKTNIFEATEDAAVYDNPWDTPGFVVNNCRIEGAKRSSGNADHGALIFGSGTSVRTTVQDSYLGHCRYGVFACSVTATGTIFERQTDRALTVDDGSRITGCRIQECDNKSAIFIRAEEFDNSTTATSGYTVRESLIEDNYFNLSWSAHGQAISLYEDGWQTCVIRNNVFHNVLKALVFKTSRDQVGNDPSTYAASYQASTFTAENNLCVQDTYVGESEASATTTWRNDPVVDSQFILRGETDSDPKQENTFRNNMIYMTPKFYNAILADTRIASNWYRVMEMSYDYLVFSDTKVYSNVVGAIVPTDQDHLDDWNSQAYLDTLSPALTKTWSDRKGLKVGNNYLYLPPALSNFNTMDPTSLDFQPVDSGWDFVSSTGIDPDTFEVTPPGPVTSDTGVKWNNVPRQQYLANLPLNWTAVAIPNAIPTEPTLVYQDGSAI